MRHLFLCLLAFSLFLLVGLHNSAYAQTTIGVVDVEKVLNESDAAKELNKKRSEAREKFITKLSKKESDLREEGKALFAKRKDMSDEEFGKEQKAYEAKLLEMRKATQKQKRDFEEASNVALDKLKDHLANAVQKIAQEKGYGLVISNRDVITGEKSLDITGETIKAMNDQKIKIPFKVK